MWFVYTIITLLLWTVADLLYKISAKPKEKYSHLKIFIFVGFTFGLHAIFTLLTQDINFDFKNILIYLPVSGCYALSMLLSYYGQRFVANSISSPIEESGGAITALLCFLILKQSMSPLALFSVVLIMIGIFSLVILQNKEENVTIKTYGKKLAIIALSMAFCYALLDGVGSFLDAYYLDIDISPLVHVTEDTIENVANTAYELMFFISAIIAYIIMRIKGTKLGKLKENKSKLFAAIFEVAGQYTYVFAMSGNAIVAAPVISSMCILEVVFSVIFLKEKMSIKEMIAAAIVLIGIMILGFFEA